MTGFDAYEDHDAVGLAGLIARRETSAAEVLEAAIGRVEARNPALNAVVHTFYDDARAKVANGAPAGPLGGVPYLLKDLNLFAEGTPTTSGSRLFAGFIAAHDHTLVERLRAAGLVVFGKTNSPEFGLNAETAPALHGPTHNPWSLERSAGGSSGGAAAAVAAGMVPAAHGSDAAGSIRIPAANCGLFGLKVTRGRNPQGPDIGEGLGGMSSYHAVTRTVRDAAAILDATHGPAAGDPYAAPVPMRPFRHELGAPVGRLRIALTTVPPTGTPVHPDCVAAARDTARLCADLGHIVEEDAPEIDGHALAWALRVVIGCNARNVLEMRLGALGLDHAEGAIERITELWVEESKTRSGSDYARAINTFHVTGRRLAGFFERFDVLLTPTLADPPLPLGTLDMGDDDLDAYFDALVSHVPFTPLANVTGTPAMSVPLYWNADGLPIGVMFGARFGDEATLIRLAAQLEEARPWAGRRPET